jgi:8-oxo-dGTP pyrophosphatase MutT (NUDIX family)
MQALRDSCVRTLTAWQAPDGSQDQLRRHFLDHLAGTADGWSRHCRGAHLTASALICAPLQGRVLLTLHARIGRWLQTGGHLEPADSSLPAAALREAAEESGLDSLRVDPDPLLLSRHEVPCGGHPTFHLDTQFLVIAGQPGDPRFGTESTDVKWFDHDRLPEVDESVTALVRTAGGRVGWHSDRPSVGISQREAREERSGFLPAF